MLDALTYAGNLTTIEALIQSQLVRFVHGDICDPDVVPALITEERIDTVTNFAAESLGDRSIEDQRSFLRTNVMGAHALLEATRAIWTQPAERAYRFHHVSTDEVYGSLGPADPPLRRWRQDRATRFRGNYSAARKSGGDRALVSGQ